MLYLIPTPIGNLEDLTFRARRLLGEVDLILAEDTRTTRKLLDHYDISTPMRSFHAHNEHRALEAVMALLQEGQTLGLVSDAGTPGISDPGFLLVRECHRQSVKVECLPGPSAFLPALVASGIPCDKFHFEGFLPHKKGRRSRMEYLANLPHTFVLFESPHRLIKCLEQLTELCGPARQACVARELTKIHEEVRTAPLEELADHYAQHPPKGEIVLVVAGAA